MKLGIIREGKIPPDSRVPLTPQQCAFIQEKFEVNVLVQPSPNRCYSNEEYQKSGIKLQEDLSDCDVLMGVKEIPVNKLISNKIYFCFSHTIKKQSYNRKLLQIILEKNIQLIDYEVLKNEKGQRLIAFGRFAGMVGAHNALLTYGRRTGAYDLKRMKDCKDYKEAKATYESLNIPALKIVLTGKGRVARGAEKVLKDMGIQKVEPEDFLQKAYSIPVFTMLECNDYAARIDGSAFDKQTFYDHPELFKSIFAPYSKVSDIMINGIYWDNKAPIFFTKAEMRQSDFNIKVIADVTCDIAPLSSIPSTLRASTIADPIFGYDPFSEVETSSHEANVIDMMAIDSLPNELSRDASKVFGEQFIEHIFEELLNKDTSEMIRQATIAIDGHLGQDFEYLKDYVEDNGELVD